MRKHNGKTHLNSEHILYLIFHMCQYSSVFFGNSTKTKYEKVCISPNNISNGYKIIKLITRFWEARREPDSKKREWFCMQCKAKGKAFDTDENARWYFCNLLQPGRKTREAFDEYYQQFKYDEMVRRTAMECCEDDYYDYKDNGHRYDSHHQIIPPDAPRQIDPNTIWSWIKLEFIPVGDFKMDPEMAARSEYYEEYRRIHNMK